MGHSKGTSCRTPLAKILDPPLGVGLNRVVNVLRSNESMEPMEEVPLKGLGYGLANKRKRDY